MDVHFKTKEQHAEEYLTAPNDASRLYMFMKALVILGAGKLVEMEHALAHLARLENSLLPAAEYYAQMCMEAESAIIAWYEIKKFCPQSRK